jgi:hypothetical protein
MSDRNQQAERRVDVRVMLPPKVHRRLKVIAAESDTDLAGAIGLLVCLSTPTTGSAASPTPYPPPAE